ncbi:hypothetical protein F5884DRAFT_825462 [Xylogone sp. PMI_703]|nr:hypothetical protein F5884DRAFT_825462 [Xylogone sp. PMI_703]
MMLQPEARLITLEQLIAGTNNIYERLKMVEAKCIEIKLKQDATEDLNSTIQLSLHRTLLDGSLSSEYAIPTRMWEHGIRALVQLLEKQLPRSSERMFSFLHFANSMMALLYETVPAFEDVWIERLGDLGSYRAAMQNDDIQDNIV